MRLSRLSLTAACLLGALSASAEKVQFNRDIRPIFSDTCYACHGPDENKIKGGLRLDSLEAARKGGKSGEAAIIPGKPDASEVMKRLRTDDADDHMPPAEFHKVLTKDQIALVERWIKEGAEYQGHWAFQIPVKPCRPEDPCRRQRDRCFPRRLRWPPRDSRLTARRPRPPCSAAPRST